MGLRGDPVHVGQRFNYRVRETSPVSLSDFGAIQHKDSPWVTLLTCRGYNARNDTYTWRQMVSAVLISVDPE